MKHGSLFSGIGGFDLAAEWMGWENVFHCEINPYCQKILKQHFPDAIGHTDIKQTDFTIYRGRIDIITGGFPCQPFSKAGKRRGKEDDRFLWNEMLRAIQEIEPGFVVCENVINIINMDFQNLLFDLENENYKTEIYIIPACAVEALHKRDRVWVLAYSNKFSLSNYQSKIQGKATKGEAEKREKNRQRLWSKFSAGLNEQNWLEVASSVCRSDNGIPNRLDRIKALGNSVVPQIVFELFKAIDLLHSVQKVQESDTSKDD